MLFSILNDTHQHSFSSSNHFYLPNVSKNFFQVSSGFFRTLLLLPSFMAF